MNCPDCDTLMYSDDCRCGFKLPPKTTIEIKQMGAQVSNDPIVIKEDVAMMLSQSKLTDKPFAEVCMKYAKDILKKAQAKNDLEVLARKQFRGR